MNKFKYIFTLAVVVLSTIITAVTPTVANAASIYDDVLTVTNDLKLRGDSCAIDVPFDGLVIDLINNDDLWEGTAYESMHSTIKNTWANKVTYIVSQISWTGTDKDILVTAHSGAGTYIDFQESGGNPTAGVNGAVYGDYYFQAIFSTNSSCSDLAISFASSQFATGSDYQPVVDPTRPVFANSPNVTYPSGYEGLQFPNSNNVKTQVYPGMSISIEDNGASSDTSKVTLQFSDAWPDWLNRNGLNNEEYYPIFTLTDMDDNIITPDGLCGRAACQWLNLPLGDYKARFDVVFLNPDVNADYEFKTTEAWFTVNNTTYTMLYNPNEGKYCTVRNGYEWNCTIPQPGETPELINGDPEEWVEENCTIDGFPWIDLGACVRNALHYFAEYLGINGPTINSGSTMFFQFDTNTFGLTAILTAPLTILNNLANSEYTCSTVNLPLPFLSTNLPLPCMQSYYTTYMGELYTLWQTVINGIVAYWVIVGLLKMVKDAKDPQKDQIEVLKL